MIVLWAAFLLAAQVSLVLTPLAIHLARRFGILDFPDARKIHDVPIPRIGGAVLMPACCLPLLCFAALDAEPAGKILTDADIAALLLGGLLAFFLGLADDMDNGLPASIKLLVQIAIGMISFFGGLDISVISLLPEGQLFLGAFSLPVTIFWFVLVMNAVNLVDGLDGLAAGLSLFAAITLLMISIMAGRFHAALGFAALSGAAAGFLWFNFNPAQIFMGDSGSYFIGYMLAGLSVMGSVKGPTAVVILIPILTLGIPLADVMISAIRRFLAGKGIFVPDNAHLHHQLVRIGLTHRNAVLVLYAGSIAFEICALIMIHSRHAGIALLLALLVAILSLAAGPFGLKDLFRIHFLGDWMGDILDDAGVRNQRREIWGHQMNIARSPDLRSLWENLGAALGCLGFDEARMRVFQEPEPDTRDPRPRRRKGGKMVREFSWRREERQSVPRADDEYLFRIDLPLADEFGMAARLHLVRHMGAGQSCAPALREVEHLRRTVLRSFRRIGVT